MQLKFNYFELEDMHDCRYDYLSIYDNIVMNETTATPIGKYCSDNKPPIMLSTSRALTLEFHSDESVNARGFEATYEFIDGRNCKLVIY